MKKSNLKKLFVFIATFIVVISLFSVICSADSNNGVFVPGDSITFNDTLSGLFVPTNFVGNFYFIDNAGNHIYFTEIIYQYRGYPLLSYELEDGNIEVVYSDGWLNEMYRTIYFDDAYTFTGSNLGFIALNSFDTNSNYYQLIYNIIVSSVYGDIPLNSDMELTVSLISTILSICVILLPIIVGVVIFIWIMRRF